MITNTTPELLDRLHAFEQLFNLAASFSPEEFTQRKESLLDITEDLAALLEAHGFFLRGRVPEQREELFRELKSLLPEQLKKIKAPDDLMELQAFIPVRAMAAYFDTLTCSNREALFRTLAALIYCIRTELEACQG